MRCGLGPRYSPPMDNLENGPGLDDVPLAAGTAASASTERHWLTGLLRPDALALTAIISTGAALFGFPVLDLTLLGGGLGSEAWQHGPVLVATGIAIVAGLLALRQAALYGARGWVKALAGAAVLVSSAIAIGTIIIWIFAPDTNPFQDFGPFPGETPPPLEN
jgi:hypothetical protein